MQAPVYYILGCRAALVITIFSYTPTPTHTGFSPRGIKGIVGGHSLGGVCDHINRFRYRIKEIWMLKGGVLKALGGGVLC